MLTQFKNSILASAVLATLTACGGGGDDDLKETKKDKAPPTEITSPSDEDKLTLTLEKKVSFSEPPSDERIATIKLTLDSVAPYNFDVDYDLIDGSATQSGEFKHYSKTDHKVEFLEGQKSAEIKVAIHQNQVHDADANFFVKLTNINEPDGKDSITFDSEDKAIVTISDNTPEPILTLADTFRTIVEGAKDNIAFDLTNYSAQEITFSLQSSGSISSSDYVLNAGNGSEITIPALTKSITVPIEIINDNLPEGGEKITLTITNVRSAEYDEKKSTIDIYIPGAFGLNDTGSTTYYNGVTFDSTDQPNAYPNQDAGYGLDLQRNSTLAHGGFSFVKLDINGNTLNPTATNFSCIKDTRTGLYVETKQEPIISTDAKAETNWRSSAFIYNWLDTNKKTNGGSEGTEGEELVLVDPTEKFYHGQTDCAFVLPDPGKPKPKTCSTLQYLKEMNERATCGINDWRLPTPGELRSIYNYASVVDSGAIDYFPNIFDANNQKTTVLTGSTSVDNTGSVWCLDLKDGAMKLCHKGLANAVIAVRKGEQ